MFGDRGSITRARWDVNCDSLIFDVFEKMRLSRFCALGPRRDLFTFTVTLPLAEAVISMFSVVPPAQHITVTPYAANR